VLKLWVKKFKNRGLNPGLAQALTHRKFGKPTITAKKPFSVNHLHGSMRHSRGIDPAQQTVDNLV
jgi:hypothetical protein